MRTTKLIILFTLLFVVFTLAPGYLLAEITNRIVAKVNSDIITLHDLNTSIKKLTGSSAKDLQQKNEEKFYAIRRAILDNLVNEKITEQQIAKLGIKVTARDVEQAVEKVKKENNFTQEELIYNLKQKGVSLNQYKDELKKEIERFQLVNYEVKSKIVITEEELKKYYQTHSKDYTDVSKVRLERIFLKVRNPNDKEEIARVKSLGVKILQRLQQGHDFSEMAKIYSQGAAGPDGGNLGWIKVSQLEPVLRETITELLAGEYTDLDLVSSGFQIIKVAEKKEGGLKPFEEIRDAIHSKLFKEKVEKKYATWLNKLRKESFIKITF
jgi:peptidyl-prolyl cis-trans isomerase SurA